jgi:hypothetical protein
VSGVAPATKKKAVENKESLVPTKGKRRDVFWMRISEEALNEFIKLYNEEFGKEIGRDEASEMASPCSNAVCAPFKKRHRS